MGGANCYYEEPYSRTTTIRRVDAEVALRMPSAPTYLRVVGNNDAREGELRVPNSLFWRDNGMGARGRIPADELQPPHMTWAVLSEKSSFQRAGRVVTPQKRERLKIPPASTLSPLGRDCRSARHGGAALPRKSNPPRANFAASPRICEGIGNTYRVHAYGHAVGDVGGRQ